MVVEKSTPLWGSASPSDQLFLSESFLGSSLPPVKNLNGSQGMRFPSVTVLGAGWAPSTEDLVFFSCRKGFEIFI